MSVNEQVSIKNKNLGLQFLFTDRKINLFIDIVNSQRKEAWRTSVLKSPFLFRPPCGSLGEQVRGPSKVIKHYCQYSYLNLTINSLAHHPFEKLGGSTL